MTKIIGTGPNQTPTNAMLGDMAYQSSKGLTVETLRVTKLPTSSAGLPSGALWNDAGTVKVVP